MVADWLFCGCFAVSGIGCPIPFAATSGGLLYTHLSKSDKLVLSKYHFHAVVRLPPTMFPGLHHPTWDQHGECHQVETCWFPLPNVNLEVRCIASLLGSAVTCPGRCGKKLMDHDLQFIRFNKGQPRRPYSCRFLVSHYRESIAANWSNIRNILVLYGIKNKM